MIREVFKQTRLRFSEAGIETPDMDTRVLLKHFLGLSDADLITGTGVIDANQRDDLERAVIRRLNREPVSRIIGEREFWGMNFKVTPDTLDPRPDSECLIEMAVEALRDYPPKRILDLGTGSGCLLLALLKEFPAAQGVGIDLNPKAVDVSRENMENNGLSGRATFRQGNWTDSLSPDDGLFDLIVSNPPYIPRGDIESLAPEVKNHDPILALSGGDDGLDAYKTLVTEIKKFLQPSGLALFEIGRNQDRDVQRLVENAGLSVSRIGADIAGILRVVEITRGDK